MISIRANQIFILTPEHVTMSMVPHVNVAKELMKLRDGRWGIKKKADRKKRKKEERDRWRSVRRGGCSFSLLLLSIWLANVRPPSSITGLLWCQSAYIGVYACTRVCQCLFTSVLWSRGQGSADATLPKVINQTGLNGVQIWLTTLGFT